ncbi:MAG: thioredoxin family protein [Ferruginibacter sp.]
MKKIVVALILLISFQHVHAQQAEEDTIPPYVHFPTVPAFNVMIAPDSTSFSNADLKRKQPVIFIVFSPDCGHCKNFTKELLAKYDMVKKARIIMASSLDYDLIKKFYEDDKIADYPGISMGRDGNYSLGTFFKVRSFPTVVVYDKKGNFVKRFDGGAAIEKIAEVL